MQLVMFNAKMSLEFCVCCAVAWYEQGMNQGYLSKILASGPFKHKRVSKKQFAKFTRSQRLDGCPRKYGPTVCQKRLKKYMPVIRGIHKQVWEWVAGRWTESSLEGQMLLRFTAKPTADLAVAPVQIVTFVSRRSGNPRRLVLTKAGAKDASGIVFVLKNLLESHRTSYELALEMLSLFAPVDYDVFSVFT
jgi:hypothetical protein